MSKPKTKDLIQRGADSGLERVRENMRDASQRGIGDSPEEYGGDKISEGAEYVSHKAEQAVKDVGGRIKDKVSEKVRNRIMDDRPKEKGNPNTVTTTEQGTAAEQSGRRADTNNTRVKEKPSNAKESVKTKDNYIRSQHESPVSEMKKDPPKAKSGSPNKANTLSRNAQASSQKTGIKTVRNSANRTANVAKTTVKQTGKGTVKTVGKGTVKTVSKGSVKTAKAGVKTAKAGVKTARHTAQAAAKTAKTAAQVAQKAAQAAAKAAQAAAKAAAAAAKLAAKAIAAAVKAIVAAVKGIIAAIAAGGWIAVVIIVAICVVALIVCACCGVFASNETEDGSKPMTEAIQTIDGEFRAGIDSKIADLSSGDYDEIEVKYTGDMDGDSDFAVNWNDAIAVYSVAVTMDAETPTDVVQVTPEKTETLRRIFNEMNSVSYTTEVIESEIPSEDTEETEDSEEAPEPEIHRKLMIYVNVQSIDAYAAAEKYAFTEDQMEALDAMMEPQMLPLYAELIGIDVYGGADLTQILSGLPVGTMGSDVLNIALTKVGSPYVLGAKGPNRFDCSGLVYWSINEIDPELGRNLYTSAGYQYKYCKDNGYLVGESEMQPGDLIFWYKPNCSCGAKYAEVHHTGFYLGDGMILDASSGNGRVIIRKLFNGSSYKVLAYARPYSY